MRPSHLLQWNKSVLYLLKYKFHWLLHVLPARVIEKATEQSHASEELALFFDHNSFIIQHLACLIHYQPFVNVQECLESIGPARGPLPDFDRLASCSFPIELMGEEVTAALEAWKEGSCNQICKGLWSDVSLEMKQVLQAVVLWNAESLQMSHIACMFWMFKVPIWIKVDFNTAVLAYIPWWHQLVSSSASIKNRLLVANEWPLWLFLLCQAVSSYAWITKALQLSLQFHA